MMKSWRRVRNSQAEMIPSTLALRKRVTARMIAIAVRALVPARECDI
jgi:hypothetical protein